MRRRSSRRSLRGLLVAAGLGAPALGCQHAPPPPPTPLSMTIEVTGLKEEDRAVLEKAVCGIDEVTDCQMSVKRGKAVLTFSYPGTLAALREELDALPHPGLRPQARSAELVFEGFDNIPPDVTFVRPEPGSVHTVSEVQIVVRTEATDVEAVMIGGEEAAKLEEGVYLRHVAVGEGSHNVEAVVIDSAGNAGRASLAVVVDTTPPRLSASVARQGETGERVLLKGETEGATRVLIDGKEVSLGLMGGFSSSLPVDPDHRKAEVVAVDEHGNETVLYVELVEGWSGRKPEPGP